MKYRKWSIAILVCLLIALLAMPAAASEYTFVWDEASLLSQEEARSLEKLAGDISVTYGCGVYVVTVWDYGIYGGTVRSAAENYFLSHDFGLGSDANGVLLFLSMADRDYALIAHGNVGNTAFTDYGKDALSEAFLDEFYYDDWPGGMNDYVLTSGSFLEQASKGKPVDVPQESGVGLTLVMVLLIPAVIAGISCAVMASSMKTARSKTEADDYKGDVQIIDRYDRFITRTVVRQKIETSSSSSSSRGGTTVNSGGFSGKSGKF